MSLPQWPSLRVDSRLWRTAAAVALMTTVAGGVWRFAPQLKLEANTARTPANVATMLSVSDDVRPHEATGEQRSMPAAPAAVTAGATTAVLPAAALPVDGVATEIRWTPAVARTWVNVRADASRGGQVVGVIKPAARAMLGTDRAGWRQVRSPDISGWVDPRLFEADSLRTRGGL